MTKRVRGRKEPVRRSVTLVQQARRIAQIEARCRWLRRQLRDADDLLHRERKFLRDMADTKLPLDVGEL